MNEILRFLTKYATEHSFSDAHLEQGKPLRVRGPSGWVDAGFGNIAEERLVAFLHSVDSSWKPKLKESVSLNVAFDMCDAQKNSVGRYRCSIYTIDRGTKVAVSLRKIDLLPIPLEKTGLPPAISSYINATRGLLLVTGPTGAGKTTTLMSILTRILEKRCVHVITIEDPIENILREGLGIVSQREVGFDVLTYADGVKDALRQRPDVIMVGEIRDAETAATAIRAAESGHFVLATIHARSCVGAIQKMQRMLQDEEGHLTYCLTGVIAQSLIPSTDGESSILAPEFIPMASHEVQTKVRAGSWGELEEIVKKGQHGCTSLNHTLGNLVKRGHVNREDAFLASYNATELKEALERS